MTRRIDGWLSHTSPLSPYAEYDDPAPFVSASIEYDGRDFPIDFLIDTGSDITSVMPHDAYRFLGDSYFLLNAIQDEQSLRIEGVGESAYVAIPIDAIVRLEDHLSNDVPVPKTLWIAEPPTQEYSLQGSWTLPSILGRDAIRPGDFQLSYIDNTVTLIRPDDE
jgi:hypothetical protein